MPYYITFFMRNASLKWRFCVQNCDFRWITALFGVIPDLLLSQKKKKEIKISCFSPSVKPGADLRSNTSSCQWKENLKIPLCHSKLIISTPILHCVGTKKKKENCTSGRELRLMQTVLTGVFLLTYAEEVAIYSFLEFCQCFLNLF